MRAPSSSSGDFAERTGHGWYREAIPLADERFTQHLTELVAEEAMSSGYAKWSDVKAKDRAADPRTGEEQTADKAVARERREAYVRGHQLAEMRTTAGVTQAELAGALGVSQARISKIEHGEISGIDVVRAYVAALGGSIDGRPARRTKLESSLTSAACTSFLLGDAGCGED